MSVERLDVRLKIDPELHEKLKAMADFHQRDLSAVAADYLERAIVGEFYLFERNIIQRAHRLTSKK
jgi:hypothetical protein